MDATSPRRPGALALVAEDQPILRMEAADLLTDAGFDVLEAGTAMAALAELERHPEVRLLFTDIQMPGPIDGVDLAHQVARRWPDIAIVVCSGAVMLRDIDLPPRARFIAKPVSAGLIAKAVAEVGLG